ncbi:tocopherol cyclase family protein [Cuneatibacter caecimuris]|uniref:Tocopherol cyclase-like protein n=1 Tax=Cuneatibacter caecimuris TaxID=1796618 RepID=A0A4Q7PJM0_9FIRM|nr:tocopherol cyclase family protein [Cuneatibacter caecimuris]RZT00874.1 tocopherol cyclase-like protein [Cuneatibacter caecimuris]
MKSYFEGYYIKLQNEKETIALIPALHTGENGDPGASLQVITNHGAWEETFEKGVLRKKRNAFRLKLGNSVFSEKGCRIKIMGEKISLEGVLKFSGLTPLDYDIMGPFCFLPGMQCRHCVISLRHKVTGWLRFGGREYVFRDGTGYIEGDRGHSFPERYIWTQCCNQQADLMAAAASIPIGKFQFDGCICAVRIGEKEYRLATYLGARVIYADKRKLVVAQQDQLLSAELLYGSPQPLSAPMEGRMERKIHENAACLVRYRFFKGGKQLFDFTDDGAGFEGEW